LYSRVAAFSHSYRFIVVLFWLIVLVSSSLVAPKAIDNLVSGGFDVENTESAKASKLLEEMGLTQSTIDIVFRSNEGYLDYGQFLEKIDRATSQLNGIPEVAKIQVPQNSMHPSVSDDGRTVIVVLWIDGSLDETQRLVPEIRSLIEEQKGISVYVTGFASVFYDIEKASENDLRRGETVSLPLVLLVLLFVFGAALAAFIPLITGLVAIAGTVGLIFLASLTMEMSVFSLNIATFLGLGASVDYSLLIVSRFREELDNLNVRQSVIKTVETAGKSVFFSASTTSLGLAGLLFFDIVMLRSIAVGGIIVIALSAALALTLTPALLSIIGTRVNRYRIPFTRRHAANTFWSTMSKFVMRRPLMIAVPILCILLFAGIPFQRIQLGAPAADMLPESYESRKGMEIIKEHFGPGWSYPIIIAVKARDGSIKSAQSVEQLKDFTSKIGSDSRVDSVFSIVDFHSAWGTKDYITYYSQFDLIPDDEMKRQVNALSSADITYITVNTTFSGTDLEARELVSDIRSYQPRGPTIDAYSTGLTAGVMDSVDFLYDRFPFAIALVVIAIYFALFILFRSVLLPAKAVVMNALSIFASFGALVFIFQEGRLSGITGVEATGQIEATLPILLFFILFGISMDYEVFLLSRIRESYLRTGDNNKAIPEGLEKTGPVITSAALIIILVGLGFATGDLLLIKIWAIGLVIGVTIDVTIVRSLMVPSLMKLFGRWNWWAPRILNPRSKIKTQ
tara:strand:- start:1328 stop:3538 length:2211 start_codon:yes stop_codon:yes gene_type:complete